MKKSKNNRKRIKKTKNKRKRKIKGGTKSDEVRSIEPVDILHNKVNIIEDHFPNRETIIELERQIRMIEIEKQRLKIMQEKLEQELRRERCDHCSGAGILAGPVVDGYPISMDQCHYCE